jgi:hypothetical protein
VVTAVRRTEVVAGFMAAIFGCVGLLLFLFVPAFVGLPINARVCSLPCHPNLWPDVFYMMTHTSGQLQRDLVLQVASMVAGYLLLVLLVALAATRQARRTSLRWTVLLWLATAMLAVEVVSVSVNARSLVLPFLIPEAGSTYLVTYLLPSAVFAVVSALAALVALVGQLVAIPHAWRAIGNTADAAV